MPFTQVSRYSSTASFTAVEEEGFRFNLPINQLDLINDLSHLSSYHDKPLPLIGIGTFLFLWGVVLVFAIVKANINRDALMEIEHHLFMDTGMLDYESQLLMQCGMEPSPMTRKNFWGKLWHAFRTEHTVVGGLPLSHVHILTSKMMLGWMIGHMIAFFRDTFYIVSPSPPSNTQSLA